MPGWFRPLVPPLALLLAAAAARSQPLDERVAALEKTFPAVQRAHWGACVIRLDGGEVVFARDPDSTFVPASNMKLLTTALGLVRLGPDYHFQTRVVAERGPDNDGVLQGDLRLVGGGDPTLSGRAIPYRRKAPEGDPLEPLLDLAEQVSRSGVRRITGDVVGDDTAYLHEPYPQGWAEADALWEYGAPVSALTFNDSSVRVVVRPGDQPGEPARLAFSPLPDYLIAHNRVETVAKAPQKIHLDRAGGSRQVELWGTVLAGKQGASYLLAVGDAAHYAAFAFREALRRKGVQVDGEVRPLHRYAHQAEEAPAGGVELARRLSPPLVETLKIINKVSQNLHAEIVLREVARASGRLPSRETGLEELKTFLEETGSQASDVRVEDGSGLSRLNLLTPRVLARLLAYMHRSPHRSAWVDLLPVGGEDGTLSERFRDAGRGQISAKTGTISHVSTLSGYTTSAAGQPLAFSVMVNNANAPSSTLRRFIDKIVLLLRE